MLYLFTVDANLYHVKFLMVYNAQTTNLVVDGGI